MFKRFFFFFIVFIEAICHEKFVTSFNLVESSQIDDRQNGGFFDNFMKK